MPNTKDIKLHSESILALGFAGSGKTAAFATLPGKKFLYVFDPNSLATLKGQDIDYEEFVAEHMDLDAVTLAADRRDRISKRPEPKTYVEFEKDIETKIRDNFFDDYDVIGFDSLTTLTDIVMDRIMYLNNRFGKWPEQADYTATINTVTKILRTVTSFKALIYVTGHLEFKQEDSTGRFLNTLSLLGRLRVRAPLLFSNLYQFYAEENNDKKTSWYVRTEPDRYNPYLRKSRGMKNLNTVEDITVPDDAWSDSIEGFGLGKLIKEASSIVEAA
jgi:hypothetical protein